MSNVLMGEVRNGVVVFEGDAVPLAEGTKVRIEPIALAAGKGDQIAWTRSWLLALAEKAEQLAPDLPSDMAENHDHYAHGKPRT